MRNYWGLDIKKVEKKYNGKYIADMNVAEGKPLAVFYEENPNKEKNHSNYFGIGGNIISVKPLKYQYYITNAEEVLEKKYPALELPNGKLLMSLYEHDYKEAVVNEQIFSIDGGDLEYCWVSPPEAKVVSVGVKKDKIVNLKLTVQVIINYYICNMDIKKIKNFEMSEILDFYYHIEEYGHIYHYPPEKLNEPFKKIMEGIEEVQQLMNDSFEMQIMEKVDYIFNKKNLFSIEDLEEQMTEKEIKKIKDDL